MVAKAARRGFFKRGRFWYTIDPLTRAERSTGFTDLEAARTWRAKRERFAADPATYTRQTTTLGDECRRMIDALAAIKRPVGYYEGKLANWLAVLGNDFQLAGVGPEVFDRFIAERRDDGVTDHTISKEIKCMITTLRFARRAGRYTGDIDNLRPLGFSAGYVPRTRTVSIEELRALLPVLDEPARAFVVLALALGLRRGELLSLRPGDVDLSRWTVRVRGTKTAGAARTIPVLTPFRDLVADAARYLPLTWGKSHYYTRDLARACRLVGIEPFTPNDLRRTHATLLRSAGVGADVARTLLGHTKGSLLLEQTYDKPKPHELAARAGDLSGLTAEIDSLGRTRKVERNMANSHASDRPWGPSRSATGAAAPPNTPTKPGEASQEPARTDGESRSLSDEESDFLAALAEADERCRVAEFLLTTGGVKAEPRTEDEVAGG